MSLPLPYCGVTLSGCVGIRVNHGLYTQCGGVCLEGQEYCKNCNNTKRLGSVHDRVSALDGMWMGRKITRYSSVMNKLNITKESAELAASKLGLIIPAIEFEKVRRGRKAKEKRSTVVEDTDSDNVEPQEKKKRGRPRKEVNEVESAIEQTLSQLMSGETEEEDIEIETIRWPRSDKSYGNKHQYLLDEKTNLIYDKNSYIELGSWDPKNKRITHNFI
tara:strand:+ start:26 stop:679 length:654 start_codon:yes stop_codon:yes gene_type:complete